MFHKSFLITLLLAITPIGFSKLVEANYNYTIQTSEVTHHFTNTSAKQVWLSISPTSDYLKNNFSNFEDI